MKQALFLLGALAGACIGAPAARAQGLDLSHGGPVQVTASAGIDWHQNEKTIVARGNAKAVRDNVTVTADELVAHYRKKAPPPGQTAAPPKKPAPGTAGGATEDQGANEIYRLDATGHVHIYTQTDQAWGDHAVYDMDQAVLVLTGHNLKLTTPQDVITSKDSLEYWAQKHMAVARGDAIVTTTDGRRIKADTLVAYTVENPRGAPGTQPTQQVAEKSATPGKQQDPLLRSSKLQRVEAFGNVEIRTATETVYGDRGVYVPDTGIARIVGHVRITRGENQVNGNAADVDLKTGVSTLLAGTGEDNRVHGLIMPNDAQSAAGAVPGAQATTPKKGAKP